MMVSRAVYFGLQNNLDLLPLPSKQKKKQSDSEVKQINKSLEEQMANYMKQISNAYYFAEANGFPNLFDPPTEEEEKDSKEFREQRKEEAKAREQRFTASLRAMAEAHGNQFPEGD